MLAPLPEEDDGEGTDIVDAGDVSTVRDGECVWMGIYEGTGSVAAKLTKELLRRLVMGSVHESGGNMHRYVSNRIDIGEPRCAQEAFRHGGGVIYIAKHWDT